MATLAPAVGDRWAHLPAAARGEIDVFETELRRVQAGQMPEKVFLEFRLRHGVYGQRQDGVQMQRIKIPMGILTTDQMIGLANLSEEYAVGVAHITTRQDVQYHYVDINDTPNLMRRLAEVGITTKEACGNVVRNVTACPQAGVCTDETFDVTPYARAMAYFLLRHPDAQNFGRKFKIAYSGCEDNACGLARMHDIGAIAKVKQIDGKPVRGFQVYVGGGLGALPFQAKLYSDFLPADELLPLAQAIARVFARLGEKQNRAKARMKFLIASLGFEQFKREVSGEIGKLPHDPQWQSRMEQELDGYRDEPLKGPSELQIPADASPDLLRWLEVNARPQAQQGYSMVEVFLPLGDISSDQLRDLAALCRRYVKDTIRTTVEQNLLIRWVSNADLIEFHEGLRELKLADAGAGRMADITACPGTDSCKLGIASSRGLAAVLHQKFQNGLSRLADRDDLKIKISGCFNSCGQHHIADIGLFGSVQRKGSHSAPVFQITVGGTMKKNAASYGLVVSKIAAKNAPDAVAKLTDLYSAQKQDGESFNDFAERLGRSRLKEELDEFAVKTTFEQTPELYEDNRQPWEYKKSLGVGECAGEVVDQAEFMLEDADRLNFEATLALDEGKWEAAAAKSFEASMKASDGLLSTRGLLLSDNYDTVSQFRRHFYDTGQFLKPFAENFFRAAEEPVQGIDADRARQRVEETTLFIEQAQTVYTQS
ncbi:MAG TPA: nitrite/sulfite reductase [Bryobacterales bacterium]|nr:nitrite/sulfite reductase [Bryobacterales bacterium]